MYCELISQRHRWKLVQLIQLLDEELIEGRCPNHETLLVGDDHKGRVGFKLVKFYLRCMHCNACVPFMELRKVADLKMVR